MASTAEQVVSASVNSVNRNALIVPADSSVIPVKSAMGNCAIHDAHHHGNKAETGSVFQYEVAPLDALGVLPFQISTIT